MYGASAVYSWSFALYDLCLIFCNFYSALNMGDYEKQIWSDFFKKWSFQYSVERSFAQEPLQGMHGRRRKKLLNAPPSTLCSNALALHYANVIIVIEKLAALPHLIDLAADWADAIGKIIEWLSPLAHNMINWQSDRNFEQHHLVSSNNVLLLQTLYYANQGKAEAAITELLVGLNYLWRYAKELNENALIECGNGRNFDDCLDNESICGVGNMSCNTRRVAMIKSDKDNRYGLDSVVSHDGAKMHCFAVPELSVLRSKMGDENYNMLDVIGIDEAQFFEDLYDFCHIAADHDGKTVIVAGLDGDYLRRRFGSVLDIIPLADSVTKLNSRCELCGRLALFTLRKSDQTETELIGGADVYMPVCRRHYVNGQAVIETTRSLLLEAKKIEPYSEAVSLSSF